MQGTLRKTLVIALVLASLFSAAQFWESTRHREAGRGALDAWEARLSRAKEALPIKRGVIGYVGEWDVPGFPYAHWDQESEFLLSQYALARLVLQIYPSGLFLLFCLTRTPEHVFEVAPRPGKAQ